MDKLLAHFATLPLVPVVTLDSTTDAVQIAETLLSSGIQTLEVTLRSPEAMEVIRAIRRSFPQICLGAGTILDDHQVASLGDAIDFAVSPGSTPKLLDQLRPQLGTPIFIPGVATASEVMTARAAGFQILKFFPANGLHGYQTLSAWQHVFPDVQFVPTGGLQLQTAVEYLRLPNVIATAGTWIAPKALIKKARWDEIQRLARITVQTLRPEPCTQTESFQLM